MVTGEKFIEVRKPSKWIKSRLENKEYDIVKFVNGYGKRRPFFTVTYLGFTIWAEEKNLKITFSNGLQINCTKGDYIILLGCIQTGNLK